MGRVAEGVEGRVDGHADGEPAGVVDDGTALETATEGRGLSGDETVPHPTSAIVTTTASVAVRSRCVPTMGATVPLAISQCQGRRSLAFAHCRARASVVLEPGPSQAPDRSSTCRRRAALGRKRPDDVWLGVEAVGVQGGDPDCRTDRFHDLSVPEVDGHV